MATRIFELARELDVTSKVVLTKCRAEGLEIKNHMSTVSAGLEATIREWFSEGGEAHTAVETSEHIDLKKARKEAKKVRRRRKKAEAPAEEAVEGPAPEAGAAVAQASEAAEVVEPAAAETAAAGAPAAAEEAAVEAVAEAPVEAAEAALGAKPEAKPEQAKKAKKAKKPKKEEAAPSEPEEVGPAGPQVVPKPAELKGPRIIRYEEPEPDWQRRPRRRPPPAAAGPQPTGPPPRRGRRGEILEPIDDRKPGGKPGGKQPTKRRSPRRKGGRSADSGDRVREWRNADLAERNQRLAAAAGGGLRRHRAPVGRRSGEAGPAVKAGPVEIEEPITIKDLSAATGLKATAIIRKMMELGTMATVNQTISADLAEAAVVDFGIELIVKRAQSDEEHMLEVLEQREKGDMTSRAPVVTFLGHVDHGKTSLLDRIRETTIADGEAGGITQHIGAYRYDLEDKHVVFLDTPGHEAFTAMRARGANMTDVVVLVVAADDGVMPQTAEAISHAKAAEVPIVVALNKIDLPNANVQRVLGQLAEYDLQPREWGGSTEVIQTSATAGEGIDALVETLSLEAELLELEAEHDAPASGYVIESEMDPGRGAVARLLVLDGTLKVGDVAVAGRGFGRVRAMMDSHGQSTNEASPATPVEVAGLDEVPEAGDRFYVVSSLDKARTVAQERREQARSRSLSTGPQVSLENLFSQIEAGRVSEVRLIVKADVQGSLEALIGSLNKLTTDEVRVNILHSAVGGISAGDVALAEASNAIIIGFNVVPAAPARREAEDKGVDIRQYRVIYDLIEDITGVLEQGLAPEVREESLGRAEVRQVFKVSRVGTIAGCYVTDGKVTRNALVRIIRNNVVLEDSRALDSLKRFKDDAREVRNGMECGLKITGYDDVKEGDELEFYQRIEVERKL
ncbi:MAG: translation initiation factor IF-2 [Planctomycetota bacterium]